MTFRRVAVVLFDRTPMFESAVPISIFGGDQPGLPSFDVRVIGGDGGAEVRTNAGVRLAGIDLCLHLVRREFGAEAATAIARRMVVAPHRAGGQAQFVEHPVPGRGTDDPLGATLDWAVRHLDHPLGADTLAARAHMSRRTFDRRFREATGTSPARWLPHQRVLLAQRLLERSDLPIEQVARRSGFASSVALRQSRSPAT